MANPDLDSGRQALKPETKALQSDVKLEIEITRNVLKAELHRTKVQIVTVMLLANAVVLTLNLIVFRLLEA